MVRLYPTALESLQQNRPWFWKLFIYCLATHNLHRKMLLKWTNCKLNPPQAESRSFVKIVVNDTVPVVFWSQTMPLMVVTYPHDRHRRRWSCRWLCSRCFLEIRRFEAGFVWGAIGRVVRAPISAGNRVECESDLRPTPSQEPTKQAKTIPTRSSRLNRTSTHSQTMTGARQSHRKCKLKKAFST